MWVWVEVGRLGLGRNGTGPLGLSPLSQVCCFQHPETLDGCLARGPSRDSDRVMAGRAGGTMLDLSTTSIPKDIFP